ncbi:MAG: sensor histidine kinase [Thermoanaerobaculaceae bacterium]
MRAELSERLRRRKQQARGRILARDRGRSNKIIATLHLVTELLDEALTPEQAAWIALVALTAGEGFGFNRAFILRRNDGALTGWLGIGARSGEEAARLWGELQQRNVKPLATLRTFNAEAVERETAKLKPLLEALSTPIQETCNRWLRAFVARLDDPNPCLRHWFGVLASPALVILPLVRGGKFWGLLLADNFVTKAPVSGPLLDGAQTLCHVLQAALERTELWARFRAEQESRQRAQNAVVLLETARSLAHDIKNPLVAASGLLQYLLQNKPESREEWEVWAEKIAQGLRRVETQVNCLVQELASRGEGMQLVPTDVVPVVEGIVTNWQPLATSRNVQLELEKAKASLVVSADPSYLDRCVENLLSNAVKAVGLGGTVRVSLLEEQDWIRIKVADNGQPLPQPLKSNPFAGEVLGLPGEGLSSVRRLTEAMGGKVEYGEDEYGWVEFSLLLKRCR